MIQERKYHLDNLRTFTVMLVPVYHVFYMFNGAGVLGGMPNPESIPLFDGFCTLVYPWFMVLLFCVAGIAARYSLQKRGGKTFLRERAVKLLLPSTAGLFVIHWITGYLNIRIGGALEYIPAFLVYPISVLSGIGPLWFVQTLFLFSLLLVPITKLDRRERFDRLCGKAPLPVLLLLVLPIWGSAQILNLPVLTMYRFGIYFTAFFIGYFILSHDEVTERLERAWLWTSVPALLTAVIYMWKFHGSNYASDPVLKHLLTNIYLWLTVLAALGVFRKFFNKQSTVGKYLAANSYGFYILHYPILITITYLLHFHTALSTLPKIGIILIDQFVLTWALNELLRRIPLLRTAVLGIRKRGKT